MKQVSDMAINRAKTWMDTPIYPKSVWTGREKKLLRLFFSNITQRIFFLYPMPQNMTASLLAVYSRIKNPRGLRGLFVDSFIPQILGLEMAAFTAEVKKAEDALARGDTARKPTIIGFLKEKGIKNLATFINYSAETAELYDAFFYNSIGDPEYLERIAGSDKFKVFLGNFLDRYGHNSIARPTSIAFCCEEISLLAAKALEWIRPGAGFIEFSTRFVDASKKGMYPFWELSDGFNGDTKEMLEGFFRAFKDLQEPFAEFLREEHGHRYVGTEKELEYGIAGEVLDVLGNLLPACTLTSVGMGVSGESLNGLIKHLYLEGLPETTVLAQSITQEAKKVGADQFIRHPEPTVWDTALMRAPRFTDLGIDASLPPREWTEEHLLTQFQGLKGFSHVKSFSELIDVLTSMERGYFDKLPYPFESITGTFYGVPTFRTWRDIQRHGFCSHNRTLLTTKLGFYTYPKPASYALSTLFGSLQRENTEWYEQHERKGLPELLRQYGLMIGFRVGCSVTENLRQSEFCGWQRGKPGAHEEARRFFLGIDVAIERINPWWRKISRADTTPLYVFARLLDETKGGIPLELEAKFVEE